jgi:arabinoxylan arabinofuranohydrolase
MKQFLNISVTFLCITAISLYAKGQNPIIQSIYTADPAPMVYKDTLYLYTGHDEDNATWFTMKDWRCYATTDMVNWTDHGSPLSIKTFKWAKKDAWAGQCIYRNGKFYWYVPMNQENGKGMAIGVAVSSTPTGPFVDALGKPLVHSGNGDIDPTVFIDNDGQAYLYWGNPYLKYIKLNEDMISYSGEIVTVPLTKEGFHVRYKDADKRPSSYEEGPWLYKRKGLYYLLYPAGGVPEHLAYSTSTSATGPWKYRDTIMGVIKKGGAFTNHPGVIDYKGKSYFFYHNGALPGGGGFTRSVAVEQFQYNPDGTIPRITPTVAGVSSVSNLNPYKRVEAETIAWAVGVETALDSITGMYVTDIDNGDFIKVRDVGFLKNSNWFKANVASVSRGASIEIHIDSLNGDVIGTCNVISTGSMQNWTTHSCELKNVRGVHDVYFVFKGGEGKLFNFDWWRFHSKKELR